MRVIKGQKRWLFWRGFWALFGLRGLVEFYVEQEDLNND
jgi:hypothetical protein